MTRDEIRVAKARSRSVGFERLRAPLGERRAEVLGDLIEAVVAVFATGTGKPCMSSTSISEPSLSGIGFDQIMIPLVVEGVGVFEASAEVVVV